MLLEPGVAGIAHDLEQPGTNVCPVKPAKELERAQIGLLDHILRVDAVLCQPARQVKGRVEVWKDCLLKTLQSLDVSRRSLFPNSYSPLSLNRPVWALLYSPVPIKKGATP